VGADEISFPPVQGVRSARISYSVSRGRATSGAASPSRSGAAARLPVRGAWLDLATLSWAAKRRPRSATC